VKNLQIDSMFSLIIGSTYLNVVMCKFESSQKDKCGAQSTDSSKAYRKPSAFNWTKTCIILVT